MLTRALQQECSGILESGKRSAKREAAADGCGSFTAFAVICSGFLCAEIKEEFLVKKHIRLKNGKKHKKTALNIKRRAKHTYKNDISGCSAN